MKQESKKKSKLWLWLVIALAALIVAGGVLLAFLLPGQQGQTPQDGAVNAELYWNLHREQFIEEATGLSTRTKGADGLYHMTFAYQGQHVELTVVDKQLVNFIDSMTIVGLVLDADGIIVDAVEPETVATLAVKDAFVRKVEGGNLVTNSSQTMNGMEQTIPMTDSTGVYDVSVDAELCGAKAECDIMDTVTVYTDAAGNATHVYITKHPVNADVYWRVGTYYDSVNACTTRVPDENGVYTMLYACNGEQVELKCRDRVLVSRLDSYSAVSSQAALLFDEEGYVVDNTNIPLAIRGVYLCKYYTVTAVEGDRVTVERIQPGVEQSLVKTFTLGKDCDIFMCCSGCHDSHIGERTDHLRVGDTVDVYTDLDGIASLIFVSTRPVDSQLYYNLAQKYNSVTKETRREPENGWYVFEMFCEGKTVTVKTRDKAVANQVDSMLVMGLKLEGNVVQRTYATRCVSGTNSSANSKYVTSVMGSIFTAAAAGSFDEPVNAIMSPDCKIYDMTGDYGVKKGSLTTIQPYDRVFVYSDMYNLVTRIFVRSRYAEGSSIYYNVSRKYDTEKQVTTRVPDENGYYVFEMITNGKTVTVKTKSKDMASFIDAQSAPTVALKVSGDIIREAHLAEMAVKYGSKADNYVYVDKVNKDGTYTTYYYSGETRVPGAVARKISKNCKIYNVSAAYAKYRGEITTLKPNDRIQAIVSGDTGEAVMLFVLSREIDSPMYYHVKRMYDTTKAETRRTPNADGWYVFDLAVNGQIKQFKTKDKAVASEVDQFSTPFVMITEGDVIIRACNATFHKDVKANAAGRYDVMSMDGDKITLTRNRPLADNYGDTKELTLAKGYKVYDVSSYAPAFGAEVQLQLGDRVICYENDQGEISYIYIILRNTRKAGSVSYCEHCKKDVFWNPYEGEIYATDAHYYLTCDTQMSKGKTLGADNVDYSVCLDLNGKSLFCKYRPFLTYTDFSILDSAGGGSLVSGCVSEIALGGCITVAGDGTLNLYGGTLTLQAGGNAPGKGGVVNVGYGTTFNMYGGAVKGGYVTDQGGNIYVNGSTFNMYGGTVEGGTADLSGGNICTAAKSTVTLAGGTITGDVVIGAGSTVTLSGDTVITAGQTAGLKLNTGDVLTLGDLSRKASIVISAEGVFTEVKENITDYRTFFKPFDSDDTIEVQEGALAYVKTPVDLNRIDNSDLVFDEGTTKAVCPVCEVKVNWIALTDARTNMLGGGHYYVAEDITYEGGTNWYITAPESGTACLHLNGHSITSPTRAIQGNFGVLNVMGNGTVTGNFTDVANLNRGAVVDTTPSKASCADVTSINLLGGTYQQAEGNTQEKVISIWNNGGRIRIYDGATVKGGIYVGTSGILVSELGIFGGTVEGSILMSGSQKNESVLILAGGTVDSVRLPANALCGVIGAPVVNAMQLAEGAKLTLGELTEGASLTVNAKGVFTEPSELAESLRGFFHETNVGDTIEVQENALVYIPVPSQTNPYLADLSLDANGYAQCPACQAKVKWTALTEKKLNLASGNHYYLASDVTYEGGSNWHILAPTSGTACLHLNGHNLTSPTKAIQGNLGVLNVMGTGTVTGNYTDSANPNRGAVVDTTPSNASCAEVTSINLLGGTYQKAEDNTQNSAVSIWNNGGRIRVYDGATVKGGIYVGTSNILASELAVSGGTVEGGITLAGSTKNTSTLNLTGGTVDSVRLPVNAVCNVSGTPVVAAMQLAEGAKLTLGELTEDASLTVSAKGVFTEPSELAESLRGFFHETNVGDTITVENNTLVYTPAIEEGEINPTELTLDANGYGMCYACKKRVQWTELNAQSDARLGFKNDKTTYEAGTVTSYHYYLSDDLAYAKSAQYAERYYNITCLHLNGHSLSFNSRMSIGIGATLNVMGNGSVTGSCDSATAANNTSVLYTYNGGVINLYGGSYSCTNADVPAVLIGGNAATQVNICDGVTVTGGVKAKNGTVTVSGSSVMDKLTIETAAKLVVSEDWSGTATASFAADLVNDQVPAANGVSQGAYTGKLYLDAAGSPVLVNKNGRLTVSGNIFSQPLELDADGYAECPACKKNVQWTELNAQSDARLGFKNDKTTYEAGTVTSYHYYLSDDLAYAKSAQYAERYYNITCLHLNGHSLSFNSRMSIGIGATLNIMGTGSITGSCNSSIAANNTSVLYTYNGGVINLYGGSYRCTNAEVPAVLIGSHAPTQINIYEGVTVTGGVKAKNGTVTVSGNSVMDKLTIEAAAKLVVSANWSGSAEVSFASQLVDGAVPAKNGASLGVYTGILTMDSKAVVGKDGALVVRTFDPTVDDGVLKILGIGNSYTADSMHLLYDVYKAENPNKEIVLGYLYYGGCSLASHATFLTNNTAAYTYYKLDSQTYAQTGVWQQASGMTMRLGILDEQWDVVTMQQNSGNSTNAATYSSKIGTIRDYVEQTLGYKPSFGWNFTWGYPDDAALLNTSTTANFAQNFFDTYGTTEGMYNRISAAVQEKIVNGDYSFDYLMPVGTAVQNARSNHLAAKDLYRDSLHLNNLGRLIAAYTWYCELEGYNGTDKALTDLKLTQVPASLALSKGATELDAQLEAVVIESVNNAMKNKFAVTKP